MNQHMRKRAAGSRRTPSSPGRSQARSNPAAAKAKGPPTEEHLHQGEARFRALVETATDWIWEVDSNGAYTYASPKVRDLLGCEPGEVIGKTPFDFMLPEEAERLRPVVAGLFAAKRPFANLENLNRHKDGHVVLLETSGNPIIDAAGRLQGYRGVDRDITERKRAEEERRQREEEFRAIVETTNEWIWTIDAAGRHTYSNPALQRILGYSPAEFMGQVALKHLHPDDRSTVAQMMATEQVRKEGWSGLLLRWRHKDGSYRYLESNAVPVFDADGVPAGFRGADRDITDRKRAEEERDRQFQLSIDLLCLAGFDGRIRRVNPAWIKTLGWTETELTSRPYLDFVHPEDREATLAADARLARGEKVLAFENRYRCKDGSYRWLSWNSFPVPDEGLIIGVVRDVTEQRQIEEALRESEARFRSLYEYSPDAILLTIPDGRILAANPAATRMFGRTEAEICRRGRNDLIEVSDSRLGALLAQRGATGAAHGELTFRRADGTWFPGEVSSSVFAGPDGQPRTCMVIHDISQRKLAEANLLDSERRYRLLMENISDVVWVLDVETLRFRYVSPAVERLRGYTADEVLRQSLAEVVTPDSLAFVQRTMPERVARFREGARGPYTDEIEQPCRDGTTIWTEVITCNCSTIVARETKNTI